MATVQSNLSANQSSPSPIELADRAQRRIFVASVIFGVAAAIIAAILASLVWKSNNAYQAAVKSDADARIAEAGERASKADERAAEANLGAAKANEGLAKSNEEIARLTKEAEQAKTERAEADKQIAIAKANAARADEGAAKAAAEVARLQVVVANAEAKRAEAERALLELQERLKDRHLTAEQRARLLELLRANPKGAISVACIGGSSAEPCNFADEIVSVLTEAGWQVDFTGRGMMVLGGTPVGLIIQVHRAEKAPIRAEVLQKALGAIGFPAPGAVHPDMKDDVVNLVVGAKPQ